MTMRMYLLTVQVKWDYLYKTKKHQLRNHFSSLLISLSSHINKVFHKVIIPIVAENEHFH